MSNEKWFWMMDWCKERSLAPANSEVWKMAEKAYEVRKDEK